MDNEVHREGDKMKSVWKQIIILNIATITVLGFLYEGSRFSIYLAVGLITYLNIILSFHLYLRYRKEDRLPNRKEENEIK